MTLFWRSYVVWKKTGINPVTFMNFDIAHDFIGRAYKLAFALLVLVVLVYALSPAAYAYLAPIRWLEHPTLRWIGASFVIFSLVWIIIAQAQMGEAWRIGIDTKHRTPLVQKGLFRISRNPIYIGGVMMLSGLFLIIPNALTLLILILGLVLIGVQVRLEEEHVAKMYPREYAEYCQRVRRWL
ncbi:MAG TPA: isoprenylcysteine carboxylmethyltransferase family protein [Pyrinomonadaceae bacterium]|jgi:protein-S-isoprenylcysteine O-methyltransferase Ste14|nr:isoprenylcysteine carboxylmethyltransferase family protein [Pyrinomonadaceae bacterium]